jgi:hypothetical protein
MARVRVCDQSNLSREPQHALTQTRDPAPQRALSSVERARRLLVRRAVLVREAGAIKAVLLPQLVPVLMTGVTCGPTRLVPALPHGRIEPRAH